MGGSKSATRYPTYTNLHPYLRCTRGEVVELVKEATRKKVEKKAAGGTDLSSWYRDDPRNQIRIRSLKRRVARPSHRGGVSATG